MLAVDKFMDRSISRQLRYLEEISNMENDGLEVELLSQGEDADIHEVIKMGLIPIPSTLSDWVEEAA